MMQFQTLCPVRRVVGWRQRGLAVVVLAGFNRIERSATKEGES
jgi:hypothetical protein